MKIPQLEQPRINILDADSAELIDPYHFRAVIGIEIDFVIPAGFVFDLSSVPRFIRPLRDRSSFGLVAPLVHDWCYSNTGKVSPELTLPRIYCDLLFLILVLWDGLENDMPDRDRKRWIRDAVIAFNLIWCFGGKYWASRDSR